MVTTVQEEVYTPGCMTDRDWAGPLSSDTEYCYCDQDRCNDRNQVSKLEALSLLNGNLSDSSEELLTGVYSHAEEKEVGRGGRRGEGGVATLLALLLIVLHC